MGLKYALFFKTEKVNTHQANLSPKYESSRLHNLEERRFYNFMNSHLVITGDPDKLFAYCKHLRFYSKCMGFTEPIAELYKSDENTNKYVPNKSKYVLNIL